MGNWRKSSYSGPDDGNNCVEVATTPTRISIRDTKTPTRATLTFPAESFSAFLDALKRSPAPETSAAMPLRLRMRRALPEAMRARDKAAVSALRATLAALDNAEAAPVSAGDLRGLAIEESPVGAGATEAVRCELSEDGVRDIVRAEADERLEAAAQLTAPAHADRAARLRAEAAVLLRFLDSDSEGDHDDHASARRASAP